MECVYIGEDFYWNSKTHMSSVYKINKDGSYIRTDWGFIRIALEEGKTVNIRPATTAELEIFQVELKRTNELYDKIMK